MPMMLSSAAFGMTVAFLTGIGGQTYIPVVITGAIGLPTSMTCSGFV